MTTTLLTKKSMIGVLLASLVFIGMSFSFAFAATDDDDAPIVGKAKITESKALAIAQKAYTGKGKFTDIELEMEKGILVYGVEYTESDGNEVDVKVNAKTGAVVVVESDKDEPIDDDDDEGDDEDDDKRIANKHTLINLLNQLIALLKQQMAHN